MQRWKRHTRTATVVMPLALALLGGPPSAVGLPEDGTVRSPDLETAFPRLREDLSKLPPFFLDTDRSASSRSC